MKRKSILVLLICLVFAVVITAGHLWHFSDPSFAVTCQIAETDEHLVLQVHVTNTGHAVDYCGAIEDQFSHACLEVDGVIVSTSENPFVNTDDATNRIFLPGETASYTYLFDMIDISGVYDLTFYFIGQKISLYSIVL